jgi:hypothetical protein
VQNDPSISRKDFLERLKPLYKDSPFQIIFMDLIPCDPIAFNCDGIVIFMSIDYKTAGNYVVVQA